MRLSTNICLVGPELRDDDDIVWAAVEFAGSTVSQFKSKGDAITYASPRIQNDPQFLIHAIHRNRCILPRISSALINDDSFLRAALDGNILAAKFLRYVGLFAANPDLEALSVPHKGAHRLNIHDIDNSFRARSRRTRVNRLTRQRRPRPVAVIAFTKVDSQYLRSQ
jgi:hypothetical protein